MADLAREPVADLPMPRFEEFDPGKFRMVYDKRHDTLFIRGPVPRPATSVDLDGEIWLRMDPLTGEILGFEIEDFVQVFLAKHPDIANAWREAHGRRRGAPRQEESLVAIIINWIRQFLTVHPQQPRLCAP